MGDSAESIPWSDIPLSMNGKTEDVNLAPATLQQLVTTPLLFTIESILDKISHPTVSIAAL